VDFVGQRFARLRARQPIAAGVSDPNYLLLSERAILADGELVRLTAESDLHGTREDRYRQNPRDLVAHNPLPIGGRFEFHVQLGAEDCHVSALMRAMPKPYSTLFESRKALSVLQGTLLRWHSQGWTGGLQLVRRTPRTGSIRFLARIRVKGRCVSCRNWRGRILTACLSL
jgi:hypothetical protein